MIKTGTIYIFYRIIILILFFTPLYIINGQNIETIKEGAIPAREYITFKKELNNFGIQYFVNYLPIESMQYNEKIYQVIPTSIWWHWDAGLTPIQTKNAKQRVYNTYNILKIRTKNGESVSTHFSVGPNTILQMLPLAKNMITQGRLTNDLKTKDISKTPSLGGIQIETTGTEYDKKSPLPSQTTTLIKLTSTLMRQYHIPFSSIFGHLEKSTDLGKIDPGIKYLKQTRVQLLKYLIDSNQLENIGDSKSWNFYTQVINNGVIINILDQSNVEIISQLSENEKKIILHK